MKLIEKLKRAFTLEKVDLGMALLVLFILPVYHWILPPFLIVWVIIRLSQIVTKKAPKSSFNDWLKITPIFLIFLLYGIGILYSSDFNHAVKLQETMLSLCIVPLLFITSGEYYRKNEKSFYVVFILGCLTSMLLRYTIAFENSVTWIDGGIVFDRFLPGEHLDQNVPRESYFRYENLSFSHHPFYLSMYLIFSIVFIFKLLYEKLIKSKCLKTILIGSIPISIISILLLSSKAALLVFVLSMVITGIAYVRKGKYLVLLFLSLILIGVIGANNSRFIYYKRMFSDYSQFKEYMENKEYEKVITGFAVKRPVYWAIAVEQISKKPLFGVGSGDADEIIQDYYKKYDLQSAYELKHNTHNQYLDTTISLGIVGLIAFLVALIVPLAKGIKERRIELIAFISIFAIASLFESMLYRLGGVIFFAYFLSFLLLIPDKSRRSLRNN